MTPETMLDSLTTWAARDDRVLALALVGSHARGEARPDSDLDLIVISGVPDDLLGDPSWTAVFGAVESSAHEDYGLVTSVRVRYEGGEEVEFGITTPEWTALPLDPGTRRVLEDGARVLYDEEGLLTRAIDALPLS